MIDPNDRSLDEYLRRESAVSQRYREIEADEVPPELDAVVLAQARAATHRKFNPTWTKWTAPLALAASAVLIVAIVVETGVQEDVRLPAAQTEQTAAIREPSSEARVVEEVVEIVPVVPAAPDVQLDTPAVSTDESTRERKVAKQEVAKTTTTEREAIESVVATGAKRELTLQDIPATVAAVSHDQPASLEESASDPTTSRSDRDATGAEAARQTVARSPDLDQIIVAAQTRAESKHGNAPMPAPAVTSMRPAPASMPAPQQAPRLAPEAWLEQIRRLRREGKVLEADEQWKEFSAAYPTFEVAETDFARPKP